MTTAANVRKEVEKMIKVANSPKLIKLVNPARMHLNDEEELMVILQLQEPPSVDVSVGEIEEQKAVEVVEEVQPVSTKKSNKKGKKTAAAKETTPSGHQSIKRQNSPMPAEM